MINNSNKPPYLLENLSIPKLAEQAAILPKNELQELISLITKLREQNPNPVVEIFYGEFTEYHPDVIDLDMSTLESEAFNDADYSDLVLNIANKTETEMADVVANIAIKNEEDVQSEILSFEKEKAKLCNKLEGIINIRKELLAVRTALLDSIKISKSSDSNFVIAQKTVEQIESCSEAILQIDLETVQLITKIEFLSLSYGQITNKVNESRFNINNALYRTANPLYLEYIVSISREDTIRYNESFSKQESSDKVIFDSNWNGPEANLESISKSLSRNPICSINLLESMINSKNGSENKYYGESLKIRIIEVFFDNYYTFKKTNEEEYKEYWLRIKPVVQELVSGLDEKTLKRLYEEMIDSVKNNKELAKKEKKEYEPSLPKDYFIYGYKKGVFIPKKPILKRFGEFMTKDILAASNDDIPDPESLKKYFNRPNFPSR